MSRTFFRKLKDIHFSKRIIRSFLEKQETISFCLLGLESDSMLLQSPEKIPFEIKLFPLVVYVKLKIAR